MTAETVQVLSPPAGRVGGDPLLLPASFGAWGELLARAGQGLVLKEADSGRYLYANPVWLAWVGYALAEVVGRTDAQLFDAATAGALRAAEHAALQHGEPMAAEHRIARDGRAHDLAVWRCAEAGNGSTRMVSLWADAAGRREQEAAHRAALSQIEQLQRVNEGLRRELADQALRDNSSGLYTRAHFEDQLRREADLSSREHREFSIVFVEIDEPTAPAADQPAPAPGDVAATAAVQAALGRVLRSGTRAMDAACRLDERRFAVLLSGVGLATAHSRMETLRRRCATEIVVCGGRQFGFTVSMGVASFPHTAHTQADLTLACAAALHEAQRRGGNHVALAAIRLGGAAQEEAAAAGEPNAAQAV